MTLPVGDLTLCYNDIPPANEGEAVESLLDQIPLVAQTQAVAVDEGSAGPIIGACETITVLAGNDPANTLVNTVERFAVLDICVTADGAVEPFELGGAATVVDAVTGELLGTVSSMPSGTRPCW